MPLTAGGVIVVVGLPRCFVAGRYRRSIALLARETQRVFVDDVKKIAGGNGRSRRVRPDKYDAHTEREDAKEQADTTGPVPSLKHGGCLCDPVGSNQPRQAP